jgi:hypothetical protein
VWLKGEIDSGLLYEEGGTGNGLSVVIMKGEVQFTVRNTTPVTISTDYPDDTDWHLVTAVFDKGTMRLYMDGVLKEEKTKVAGVGGHGDEMGIGKVNGACSGGNAAQFTGIMDELRITRRALTTAEVQKAYQDMLKNLAVEPSDKCQTTTWAQVRTIISDKGDNSLTPPL